MKLDRFVDEALDFIPRVADGDDTGKIGNLGAPRHGSFFVNDRVRRQSSSFSRPALRRIAFGVPIGTSFPG
jgi:hypothetical protein